MNVSIIIRELAGKQVLVRTSTGHRHYGTCAVDSGTVTVTTLFGEVVRFAVHLIETIDGNTIHLA